LDVCLLLILRHCFAALTSIRGATTLALSLSSCRKNVNFSWSAQSIDMIYARSCLADRPEEQHRR
jgi:hypothetical protein